MTLTLPKTYFDIRERQVPLMFECIRQDLRGIKKHNLSGPFFDTEPFKGFARFFDSTFSNLAQTAKRHFEKLTYSDGIHFRQLWEEVASPQLKKAAWFLSIDYLVMLNFILNGKRTFYFADNLVEHLAHTELEVSSTFVRIPFPACHFVITSQSIIAALWTIRGTPPESTEPLSVFITESETSSEEPGERKLLFVCYQPIKNAEPFFVKRSLLIRSDWTIRQMLQTDWAHIFEGQEDSENVQSAVDDQNFYENQGVLLFYRVLLNCILYLGSTDADVIASLSPHRKAASMNRQERGQMLFSPPNSDHEISKLDFNLVGQQIPPLVIQRIVIEPGDESMEPVPISVSVSDPSRHSARFLVRGHWRRQPYGAGSEKRKLIWIRPFFKGPEMAELINRPVFVK